MSDDGPEHVASVKTDTNAFVTGCVNFHFALPISQRYVMLKDDVYKYSTKILLKSSLKFS